MTFFDAGVDIEHGKQVLLHPDHVAALTRKEINRAGGPVVQVEALLVSGDTFTFEGKAAEWVWHRFYPHPDSG